MLRDGDNTMTVLDAEKMIYTVDDIPKPFAKTVALALQHMLTMFGARCSTCC